MSSAVRHGQSLFYSVKSPLFLINRCLHIIGFDLLHFIDFQFFCIHIAVRTRHLCGSVKQRRSLHTRCMSAVIKLSKDFCAVFVYFLTHIPKNFFIPLIVRLNHSSSHLACGGDALGNTDKTSSALCSLDIMHG